MSKIIAAFRRNTTETPPSPTVDVTTVEENKRDPAVDAVTAPNGNDGQPQLPDEDLQHGVQDAEAVTLSWSKWTLIGVFTNIWLLYFVYAFQSSILSNLIPNLTSEWESHSLLNTIYIVADCVTAACYIPLSKMLDTWGRAEGFAFMALLATMGLVMMAACHNLATFCAAYVFYTLGFGGMIYCCDVITADISRLRNRGLAYAFTSSPYIITAFAGAKVADDLLAGIGTRWGFGIFSIVFPVVACPLYFVLKFSIKKAEMDGYLAEEHANRTFFQKVWHYIIEFDLIGVIFFSAGLTVFFLPFDLAGSAPNVWETPYIIAMIVVGFVMLLIFIAWETWVAPKPLLGYAWIFDRTVIGACLLDATYQLCYYCWDNYFTSFLRVVNDLTVADAGYVGNTFDVVSGVLLLFVGWTIRRTGRFKWLLYIAVPLYIFAQGLMIYFRRPNQNVGYLVMCQVFISIGGAVFIIVEQLAILAAVDHQHVAATLALLNVVGTVGDGMGATISGVIWQNTYPNALQKWLPESAMANFDLIYEDIETQVSYPVGSATRIAIQDAYGYAQTRMLAVGTGLMGLAIIWTLLIRNIDLKKVDQVKGMVF
ncbi:MFS siderophore iron transporter [Penicillium hispanicum]|uniref:MFS siderophore iron transporter n=1 Tax=Penicillium hispanicum TaxID=1080232 RepID=UPI0025404D63|nr:MFS siderophore iron transporter [Penicillium hispanicum]KAJ5593915.1 MFS siderophore iron transporter [Penicillium hispanicum]